jgi:hypothetical protein
MWSSRSTGHVSRHLWWIIPILFLLWMDRYGLRCWFIQDDFAWLSLLREVHESRSLANALFAPEAQGTIRPWGERGFFLLFESLFGFDSLPYRIWVLITMAANVGLVAWITRRITNSRLAGFLAPVLWVANSSVSTVLAWSSAYNEALCALFLLSALALFIRFAETGRPVWWWCQLVVFTLGFGALELNVIYPALAAAYVLFTDSKSRDRLLLSLVPLFGISVVYFFVHRAAAPLPTDGPYAIHFDRRMFQTLATYWHWSLTPYNYWPGRILLHRRAFLWIASLALAAFFVREIVRRRYLVIFCGLWFLIAIAPMVPIPDHVTDYYLTIPLIGLSMAAAWGVECAWRATGGKRWVWSIAALFLIAAYLRVTITVSLSDTHWWMDNSQRVRALVLGADAAHRTHSGKTLVLDAITTGLYENAISQGAFYPLRLDYVYLTPGSELNIHTSTNSDYLKRVVLESAVMLNAIAHDEVVVYSPFGDHLRNISDSYERSAFKHFPHQKSGDLPRRIEAGNPLEAYALGPEWFGLEAGVRWMPQRATVRLAQGYYRRLLLRGDCPGQNLKDGPVHLMVSVSGMALPDAEICKPDVHFSRLYDLPASPEVSGNVDIDIAVDRVFNEPGGRKLGLVFGTIGFIR